jgi:hypothetical protein
MFDDVGAEDVTVRVLRTPLVDRGGPSPAPVQASSARVRMVGGELQLIRVEPRGEVAPLVRPDASVDPRNGETGNAAEAAR